MSRKRSSLAGRPARWSANRTPAGSGGPGPLFRRHRPGGGATPRPHRIREGTPLLGQRGGYRRAPPGRKTPGHGRCAALALRRDAWPRGAVALHRAWTDRRPLDRPRGRTRVGDRDPSAQPGRSLYRRGSGRGVEVGRPRCVLEASNRLRVFAGDGVDRHGPGQPRHHLRGHRRAALLGRQLLRLRLAPVGGRGHDVGGAGDRRVPRAGARRGADFPRGRRSGNRRITRFDDGAGGHGLRPVSLYATAAAAGAWSSAALPQTSSWIPADPSVLYAAFYSDPRYGHLGYPQIRATAAARGCKLPQVSAIPISGASIWRSPPPHPKPCMPAS